MTPFYFIYWFIFNAGLLNIVLKKDQLVLLVILSFLILFVGFRIDNLDYESYAWIFEKSPDLYEFFDESNIFIVEPGYYLLNSLIKTQTNDVSFLFIFISFLSFILHLIAFKKLSKEYFYLFILSISSIFIAYFFTQIRQGLAISLSSLALMYLIKKENKKFYLFLSLSSLIHVSSLALLPFVFIRNIKVSNWLLLMIPIGLFMNILNLDFIFIKFLSTIVLDGHIAEKIQLFFFSERENRTISILSGINILTILIILLLVCFKLRIQKVVPWIDFLIWTIVIGFIYHNLFSNAGEVAGRLYREATIMLPFAIYGIVSIFIKRLILVRLFLLIISMIFFAYYGHIGQGPLPYKNIFGLLED